MKWLGLTGGIGTGKSTVASYLRRRSVPVIDADDIVRQLMSSDSTLIQKIRESFGDIVLNSNGQVERSVLGSIVFDNSEKRKLLESIIHPRVQSEVNRIKVQLADKGEVLAFYDVPLLFENRLQSQFDAVVVVACGEELQISRVLARNPNLTVNDVVKRIRAQIPLSDKVKGADFVIVNDGDLRSLELQVDEVLEKIKNI